MRSAAEPYRRHLPARGSQRGFTLIESIAAIVVVAVALAGILLVLNFNIAHSSGPMIRTQAYDIAAAYLDEILPKQYGNTCPQQSAGRRNWEHVYCYDGLTDANGARNQFGQPVPGLGRYSVSVSVSNATVCAQGGSPCPPAERVTVTVRHPPDVGVSLSAYRLQQ